MKDSWPGLQVTTSIHEAEGSFGYSELLNLLSTGHRRILNRISKRGASRDVEDEQGERVADGWLTPLSAADNKWDADLLPACSSSQKINREASRRQNALHCRPTRLIGGRQRITVAKNLDAVTKMKPSTSGQFPPGGEEAESSTRLISAIRDGYDLTPSWPTCNPWRRSCAPPPSPPNPAAGIGRRRIRPAIWSVNGAVTVDAAVGVMDRDGRHIKYGESNANQTEPPPRTLRIIVLFLEELAQWWSDIYFTVEPIYQ